MTRTTRTMRGRAILAVAAMTTSLLVDSLALADDRTDCANSADQAQQLRDDGKYRRAREQLLTCARDVCPGPIKRDCLEWLGQLDTLAPTVVFGAREGNKDLSDVKVSMDGAPIADKLDGKPVSVDPGRHTFRFEHQGAVKDEEGVIAAGQKGRSVNVTFGEATSGPAAASSPPATTAPPLRQEGGGGSLVPALAVGGIAVIAFGTSVVFGLQGKSQVDDLQNCKPHCAESDVDKARTKLIVADISLGVGVVAAVVSGIMILTRPKVDASRAAASPSPPPPRGSTNRPTLSFDVGPVFGGGAAALGASF